MSFEGMTKREMAERIAELEAENETLRIVSDIDKRMRESYEALEMQRLELAAVIERVRTVAAAYLDSTVSFQIGNILASADTSVLADRDAASKGEGYRQGFSDGFEQAAGRRPKFGEVRGYPGMNGITIREEPKTNG